MGPLTFQAVLKRHLSWQIHLLNPNGSTLKWANLLDDSLVRDSLGHGVRVDRMT